MFFVVNNCFVLFGVVFVLNTKQLLFAAILYFWLSMILSFRLVSLPLVDDS